MASTVIDAASGNWSLVGDIRLTTRAAIARWCPPPAGTENDPILLTHNATGELAQPTFRFQGAAIIVYGSIIGDLEGAIARGVDGGARGGALPADDIAAAESHSAAGDAACGFVLARENNLEIGVQHTFDINPLGHVNFAIYHVELFQQPIPTTPAAVGSTTNPSTTPNYTPSSPSRTFGTVTSPSTTSSETNGVAPSIGITTSPTSSSPPIAAIVIPIVIGLVMLLALIAFFLYRRRRRRQQIHPNTSIDSYGTATQINGMSHAPIAASELRTGKAALMSGPGLSVDTKPYTIASLPTSDPLARADEKIRRLHVYDAKSSQEQGSTAGSSSTSPGISTTSGTAARAEDVVQMQALSEAMQRAGFSPAALLESLNRVHARADDEVVGGTPTEARTRPPRYRE